MSTMVPAAPELPTSPPPRRSVGRLLVVVAGLITLALLLWRVGWTDLGQAFERVGLPGFALVLVIGFVETLLDAEALRRAMLDQIGLAWVLASNNAGALVNMVIPFEGGELLKAALLRRRSSHGDVLSGLVIWNYVWKVAKPLVLALCFGASLLLGHVFPKDLVWVVGAGVAISFVPYIVLRILLRQRPAERAARLFARLPYLRRHAGGWIEGAVRLDKDVHHFWREHPRAYLWVFGLIALARLFTFAGVGTMAVRLGLAHDFGSVAFFFVAQSVADYISMLIPARIGVGEGAAYLLFRLLGLDPAAGVVMTLTMRFRSTLIYLPFTLWAWLLDRPRRP